MFDNGTSGLSCLVYLWQVGLAAAEHVLGKHMESIQVEGQLVKDAPGLLGETHLRAILKSALVSEIASQPLADKALLGLRALRWRGRVDQVLFNGPAALQTVTVLIKASMQGFAVY